jgi:hypothetical protein
LWRSLGQVSKLGNVETALKVLSLIAGIGLFWAAAAGVVSTMLVPRTSRQWLSRWVADILHWIFAWLANRAGSYAKVDRVLAAQGAAAVLFFLVGFLLIFMTAFGLIFHGLGTVPPAQAFFESGSGLSTLGIIDVSKPWSVVAMVSSAFTGTIVVAIFIGFLMTLYAAYTAREVFMGKLALAVGEPAWGPEFLVRLKRLGTTLEDSNAPTWIDWICTMRVNQYVYPILNHFRSPFPYRHWVTTLLAMCAAAAIRLANSKEPCDLQLVRLIAEGAETFHLLRESELGRIHRRAQALSISSWRVERSILEGRPDSTATPDTGLSREEWDWAMEFLAANGVETHPDREVAWRNFCLLRSLYAAPATFLAEYLHAVPAPWTRTSSSKRRFETIRPQLAAERFQSNS